MSTQIEPRTGKRTNKITKTSWPKRLVESVECRKRDLVIRIADWTRQSPNTGDPAYDVEVYVGGVYDWNLSRAFATVHAGRTRTFIKEHRTELDALICRRLEEQLKTLNDEERRQKQQARALAVAFAQEAIEKHLK